MNWQSILKAKDKDWLRRQKVEERKRRKADKKKKNIAAEEADEPRRREKRLTSGTSKESREMERRWKEQEDKLVELLMTTIPEGITDEPDYERGYWLDTTGAIYHEEFGTMAIPYEKKHDAVRFIHNNWWLDSPQTKRAGINKLINFLETL